MTEAAARRRRWPKGRVRALAWGTGGAAFIMAAAPLVAAPKPPDVAAGHAVKSGAAPPGDRAAHHPQGGHRRPGRVDARVHGGSGYRAAPAAPPAGAVRSPPTRRRRPLPPRPAPEDPDRDGVPRRSARWAPTSPSSVRSTRRSTTPPRSVVDRFAAEDRRFSRFRGDSELTRVNRSDDEWTPVSDGFAEVLDLALAAAAATDGIFDPTVHDALIAAGYDRDFDEVLAGARGALHAATPCGRWPEIRTRPGDVYSTRGRASGPRRDREGMVLGSRRRGRDRHGSAVGARERGWGSPGSRRGAGARRRDRGPRDRRRAAPHDDRRRARSRPPRCAGAHGARTHTT